ncbi:MAG: nitrate ABC transporter ATP-binding protein [Verrucomicrobiota bacterium]
MSETYFETWNLGKTYKTPKGPAVIVKNFNLRMTPGEFVCIIGHSGCGKSTVLSMVAGLNEITEGGVILDHREISGAGPDRGVVFQSPCLLPWMSAFDNVMLGVNQVYPHVSKEERKQVVEHYLSKVGLTAAMHKKPSELSGGMRQRVGLARAFALSPKMLLLDEPFGMLDKLTKFELQHVLLELWERERLTAMMVTHDVDEAIFLADRVVMMTNGPEAEVGDILEIKFDRPRERHEIMNTSEYYAYREHLIDYLHNKPHLKGDERPYVTRGIAAAETTSSPQERVAIRA